MELSAKQALMLACIKAHKSITGPELSALVADFIAPIQFHQHVGRLRRGGLLVTNKVDGELFNDFSLTKKGEHALEEAKTLFAKVLKLGK